VSKIAIATVRVNVTTTARVNVITTVRVNVTTTGPVTTAADVTAETVVADTSPTEAGTGVDETAEGEAVKDGVTSVVIPGGTTAGMTTMANMHLATTEATMEATMEATVAAATWTPTVHH